MGLQGQQGDKEKKWEGGSNGHHLWSCCVCVCVCMHMCLCLCAGGRRHAQVHAYVYIRPRRALHVCLPLGACFVAAYSLWMCVRSHAWGVASTSHQNGWQLLSPH